MTKTVIAVGLVVVVMAFFFCAPIIYKNNP